MNRTIGHEENLRRFQLAVERDRLPSTFLFVGPEGIGKKTFALELSKSLLCENRSNKDLDYCNQCDSCTLFDAGNHPDFEQVARPAGKNQLLIEQFIGDLKQRNRSGLCYNFSLKPNRGQRKVAIIDEADFLGPESANCLLKILEEPPPKSVLIMIGTGSDKVLPTIRSRSQIYNFNKLTHDQILTVLGRLDLSEISHSLEEIALACQGSLAGLKLFQQEGLLEFRDSFCRKLATLDPLTSEFPKEVVGFVELAGKEPAKRRDRIRTLADFAIEFYGGVASGLCHLTPELPDSLKSTCLEAVSRWPADASAATECIERSMDVHNQVSANANQATLIESWLSDLGRLSRGEDDYSRLKAAWSY